ncbi:MAG: DNA polymerase III subunit delta [Propionibacteriaceae bacterium]|nr:DNA polymerase III subunit delta [Propionibacteriaceae bacterium]
MTNALLIIGKDPYRVGRKRKLFLDQARQQHPDAVFTEVSGQGLASGELAEITGGSLFADESIVSITDLDMLDSSLHEQLVALATQPGEELSLVMSFPGGTKGIGVVNKLKKAKIPVEEVKELKPWELPKFLQAEAGRGKLDEHAANALIEVIGTDIPTLIGALRQLQEDSEGGRVSEEQIRSYFSGRPEITSFKVADAVLSGNLAQALAQSRWAREYKSSKDKVPEFLIVTAIANKLVQLGKYHGAMAEGLRGGDLASYVGVGPNQLKFLQPLANRWRPDAIAEGIKACAKADVAVKGGEADSAFALEQLLIKIADLRKR